MGFRNLFGVTAVIAAVCASILPAAAAAPLSRPVLAAAAAEIASGHALHIVAFGSSSTQGIGASSPAFSYPSQLQALLRRAVPAGVAVIVLNRGIGGEDVEDMMRRLPGVVQERPDLVIWQTGTNDPLRGVALPRFIDLTRQGIEEMRAAHIDVMLMEPQDCPVFSRRPGALGYRDAVRAIGMQLDVPVIRRYDMMDRWLASHAVTRAQLQAPDGLHMTDAGYALLAEAVAQTIMTDIAPAAAAEKTAPIAPVEVGGGQY